MKRLLFWGRLLLSVALMGYLFLTTDIDALQAAASSVSPGWLVAAYLIGIVDRVLMAYKWNLLLKAQSIVLSLMDATATYWMSTFLGLFLPATVGGDAIRAFAVSKFGYSAADTASTIVLERGLGMLALMFMVVASIGAGGILVGAAYVADLQKVLVVVGGTGLVGLLLIVISFNRFVKAWIGRYFKRFINPNSDSKVGRFMTQLGDSYGKFQERRGLLFLFFGLSIVENLFPIGWSYILALAFQLQVSLLDCFIVVPSVLILRRLPISIDGIGVHQSAFVTLLSLTGVPGAQGLLLGVATHLLATALVLPGGLFYMVRGLELSSTDTMSQS